MASWHCSRARARAATSRACLGRRWLRHGLGTRLWLRRFASPRAAAHGQRQAHLPIRVVPAAMGTGRTLWPAAHRVCSAPGRPRRRGPGRLSHAARFPGSSGQFIGLPHRAPPPSVPGHRPNAYGSGRPVARPARPASTEVVRQLLRRDGLANLGYEPGLGLHFVGVGMAQVGIDVRTDFMSFRRVVGVQVGEYGFNGIEPLQAAPSGIFNCFLGFFPAHAHSSGVAFIKRSFGCGGLRDDRLGCHAGVSPTGRKFPWSWSFKLMYSSRH